MKRDRGTIASDRALAANLLRRARRAACAEKAAEHLDWVLHRIPDSRATERLRIRLLILEGDLDSAQSMIARRLLDRPDDALLRILRAECGLLRGNLAQADHDLRIVLAARPDRTEAMELAAQVASAMGERGRAIALLEACLTRRPDDDRVASLLSAALLESGGATDAQQAEEIMAFMGDPPPLLVANALAAQGRTRDAMEYLHTRIDILDKSEGAAQRDSMLAAYLELLEKCGEVLRVEAMIHRITAANHPQAALRLSKIMLAQGRLREAMALAIRVLRVNRHAADVRRSALIVLLVAASCAQRSRLARSASARLRKMHIAASPSRRISMETADCWRRGLLGRFVDEQRAASCAPAENASILRPLLHSAASVFETKRSADRSRGERHETAARDQLTRDLALCRLIPSSPAA